MLLWQYKLVAEKNLTQVATSMPKDAREKEPKEKGFSSEQDTVAWATAAARMFFSNILSCRVLFLPQENGYVPFVQWLQSGCGASGNHL